MNQNVDLSTKEELMVAIGRYTNNIPSRCITVFGELLDELSEISYPSVVISEMSGFLTETLEIFSEVSRLTLKKLQSKILTTDFLQPMRHFKKSRELLGTYSDPEIARKTKLLYNHIPAVIKAILQTHRRSLGMDQNTKKYLRK